MVFEHTYLERGLWRGWFPGGQSLEVSWPRAPVAVEILIHSNDSDTGDRMLRVGLGFAQAFIPLGVVPGPYEVGEEPSWGVNLSREFGIGLRWGRWRKTWEWPFRTILLYWHYEGEDGEWHDVRGPRGDKWFDRREHAKSETHPFRYVLKSGEIQERTATIFRERWVRGRHILHRLGWPKRTGYSIDVEFSDEVGERTGSWKGGTIGCGYTMTPGESPLDTLRRMERERKFG